MLKLVKQMLSLVIGKKPEEVKIKVQGRIDTLDGYLIVMLRAQPEGIELEDNLISHEFELETTLDQIMDKVEEVVSSTVAADNDEVTLPE